MKKTVVIHQPDFLPYLGFFHKLLYADLYVALDDVQFVSSSRSWTNRDKIKTEMGERWITISVQKTKRDTRIKDILLSDVVNWRKRNLDLIRVNYSKSDFFDEVFPFIEDLYKTKTKKMVDLNIRSIEILEKLFGIDIEFCLSSELNTKKTRNERLVEILKQIKATHYLSGIGAKDYHKQKYFDKAGIKVIWQDFKHPVYPQLHGEFIPNLSSIDLFFNCGIKKSREILRSC